ncbi:hypothetical protein BDN71DRAFT_1457513 [Pleurotus eryngii]|uniref:Secreted protein n=1 Tax=Pleurotus eryngii TaxID=5323 RepID=A0A9P6DA61_PLEER|nr:hypothetical protein BDN71DRAFT_1457513 [Pleurotus eryngii]
MLQPFLVSLVVATAIALYILATTQNAQRADPTAPGSCPLVPCCVKYPRRELPFARRSTLKAPSSMTSSPVFMPGVISPSDKHFPSNGTWSIVGRCMNV